jgi:carbon monoxide dehydrogenase subunit G
MAAVMTRRLLVNAAFVLCALCAGGTPAAGAEPRTPYVAVVEENGMYRVDASFEVPVPSSTALAVLTDYERIPRFMPDVKTSVVRERFTGGAIVEQEAVPRMMIFSKRVHLLLEVREASDTVSFQDVCGRSFAWYAGAWRLAERDGHTVITYELNAQPAFDVPEFLLKRLLKSDAKHMIERLRTEMERPATALQTAGR